jgi:hypothetical protein
LHSKKFFDCELLGPANLFLYRKIGLYNITFVDCVALAIQPDANGNMEPGHCMVLDNVEIHGGAIYNATILVPPPFIEMIADTGMKISTLTGVERIDSQFLPNNEKGTRR